MGTLATYVAHLARFVPAVVQSILICAEINVNTLYVLQ